MYGTPAYFTATVLFDLIPMRILPPCFFAAATYWMVGLRPGLWHLLTFLLLLVLSNMVRTLPSLFSSYACRTYKHANRQLPSALLIQMLLVGPRSHLTLYHLIQSVLLCIMQSSAGIYVYMCVCIHIYYAHIYRIMLYRIASFILYIYIYINIYNHIYIITYTRLYINIHTCMLPHAVLRCSVLCCARVHQIVACYV